MRLYVVLFSNPTQSAFTSNEKLQFLKNKAVTEVVMHHYKCWDPTADTWCPEPLWCFKSVGLQLFPPNTSSKPVPPPSPYETGRELVPVACSLTKLRKQRSQAEIVAAPGQWTGGAMSVTLEMDIKHNTDLTVFICVEVCVANIISQAPLKRFTANINVH